MVAQRHRPERGEQQQHRRRRRRLGLQPPRLRAQQLARLLGAAGAQRELGAQRPQLGGHGGHVGALGDGEHALGLLEPGQADVGMPGRQQVARRLDQPAGAVERLGRQLGGAQVRVRGGAEAGARPRRAGGRLERCRDRLVGPRRAGGELPRALRVVLRQGAGDRAVGVAPGDGGGAVVGGGAQQRMAEGDLAGRERHDPGALRALERRHVEARLGQRAEHHVAAARLGGGGDQQRAARVLAEPVEPAGEHALERRAGRQRPLDGSAALELVAVEQRGDLQQRERVAAGRGEHAARDEVGDGVVAAGLQQLERAVGVQRPDLERLDPRAPHPAPAAGRPGWRRRPRRAAGRRSAAPRATARRATAGRRSRTAPAAPRRPARAARAAPRRSPAAPAAPPARARARRRARPPGRPAAARAGPAPARTARPGRRTAAAPRPPGRACAARSCPSARSIAARRSAVLPIPGCPRRTSTSLPPPRAVSSARSTRPSSSLATDQHQLARLSARVPSGTSGLCVAHEREDARRRHRAGRRPGHGRPGVGGRPSRHGGRPSRRGVRQLELRREPDAASA